jgi:hypothetical protein
MLKRLRLSAPLPYFISPDPKEEREFLELVRFLKIFAARENCERRLP